MLRILWQYDSTQIKDVLLRDNYTHHGIQDIAIDMTFIGVTRLSPEQINNTIIWLL